MIRYVKGCMIFRFGLSSALLIWGLMGCSEKQAGGNVETENVVRARIVGVNNEPVVGAEITLTEELPDFNELQDLSVEVAKAESNEEGYFSILKETVDPSRLYLLKIKKESLAFQKDSITGAELNEGLDLGNLSLDSTQNLLVVWRRPVFDSSVEKWSISGVNELYHLEFGQDKMLEGLSGKTHTVRLFVDEGQIEHRMELILENGKGTFSFWFFLSPAEYTDRCIGEALHRGHSDALVLDKCENAKLLYLDCETEAQEFNKPLKECFKYSIDALFGPPI